MERKGKEEEEEVLRRENHIVSRKILLQKSEAIQEKNLILLMDDIEDLGVDFKL